MRVLVTGASGSGTTTLGRAVAARFGWRPLDADDFYWSPTTPPFQTKREKGQRLALILEDLSGVGHAVVSGSIVDWGRDLEDSFAAIVFLTVPASVRLARLRVRETALRGEPNLEFLAWAAQYDHGFLAGRSRGIHERWLTARSAQVLRIDGEPTVEESCERVGIWFATRFPDLAI